MIEGLVLLTAGYLLGNDKARNIFIKGGTGVIQNAIDMLNNKPKQPNVQKPNNVEKNPDNEGDNNEESNMEEK